MPRFLIIGGVFAVVFWVFSLVDCILQPATRHRGVPKGAWIAIVILIPVLGGILWFAIGRGRGKGRGQQRTYAPEDDPEYLRRLRNAEADARIAALEAELARLDDESDESGTEPRT
jgi:hypothetical protein